MPAFSYPSVYPLSSDRVHPHNVGSWKINFDGRSGIVDFLQRVEEKCLAFGLKDQQLFAAASEFISGDALIWYRSERNTLRGWSDLVTRLRESFLPFNYEASLREEIRARTQMASERIVVYFSEMVNLFGRMYQPPDEAE